MADAKLNILINAKDNASGVLGKINGLFGGMAKVAGGILAADIFKKVAGGAVGFVKDGMEMNSMLEKSTLQFTTLMGNADEAAAHVKDLFAIGAQTPFETEPIIAASKNLLTFGGKALDTRENLLMVGDAAAAVGQNIDEVAFWTGRAYSMIQGGKPFGEAAMRLQEMGILSASTRDQLEQMQKSGKTGNEVWKVFTDSMGKFNGAMGLQANTWEGLTSTISDNLKMAGATALKPFFDLIKQGMGWVATFVQSANFTSWAEKAAGAFSGLIGMVKGLIGGDTRGALLALAQGMGKAFGPQAADMVFKAAEAIRMIGEMINAVKAGNLGEALDVFTEGLNIPPEIGAVLYDIYRVIDRIVKALQSGSLPNIMQALGLGQFTGPVMQVVAGLQQFWGILVKLGAVIWSIVAPAFQTIWQSIQAAIPQFAALGPIFQTLFQALAGLAPVIGGLIVGVIGLIVGLFSGIAQAIGPFLAMVAGLFAGFATVITGIINIITGIFTLLFGLITGNSQMVQTAWQTMVLGITQIMAGLGVMIVSLWTGMIATISALVSGFVAGVVTFFTSLYMQLVGGSIIPDMVNAIIMWLQTMVIQGAAEAANFVAGLIGAIAGQAGAFYEAGKSMIDGLVQGITDTLGVALATVTDLANKVAEAAKKALGISSPSKVFAEIGKNTMLGMAQGIGGASRYATGAAAMAAGQVTNVTNYNLGVTTNNSPAAVTQSFGLMRSFQYGT